MLFRHEGGTLDVTGIADLGGAGITLHQKRLWSRAGDTQTAGQDQKENPPRSHASEATPPRRNGKHRPTGGCSAVGSFRRRADQRLDQQNRVQQRRRADFAVILGIR